MDGRWKWKDKQPVFHNQCAECSIKSNCKEEYENELKQWIADGWLEPHDESVHGNSSGVIPQMAVFQRNKSGKVKPVMDTVGN